MVQVIQEYRHQQHMGPPPAQETIRAISITTAKSTRRTDGTDRLAKIPRWNIHMVMMNDPKGSQMTTLGKKLA
eukprot:superscaffoldBa00004292_g18614